MRLIQPSITAAVEAFRRLSLPKQFAAAGGLVMLLGMLVIGDWVEKKIEAGLTENAGITTALLMDSLVAPLVQELQETNSLSTGPTRALQKMLDSPALKERVQSIKIWKRNGLIAYSNNLDLIGNIISPSDRLIKAWNGDVVTEFEGLVDAENKKEHEVKTPLLEIYSPIRSNKTGEVIAVAEFYENASILSDILNNARHQSWIIVALIMSVMGMSLFMIVLGANSTIEQQRIALANRVHELRKISDQNNKLKERVMIASARSVEMNEQFLRRVSSDLHDGPAQLVSLASLRLDGLNEPRSSKSWSREISAIGTALDDAMHDIRNICKGISLPDIETKAVGQMIEDVIQHHEIRTETKVIFSKLEGSHQIQPSAKICVYRFVQEGLNNAFRHANGLNQRVSYSIRNNILEVTVSNEISGNVGSIKLKNNCGLGLAGLRDRVEALAGEFSFFVEPENRAILRMVVHI